MAEPSLAGNGARGFYATLVRGGFPPLTTAASPPIQNREGEARDG
jgi:hypothetical protein